MGKEHERLNREIEELRRWRDQLRVRAHLGRMEADELWDDLEERWDRLEAKAKRLTRESGEALDEAAESVREAVGEIREGYERISAKLQKTDRQALWERFKSTFERIVEEGQKATERVVDSVEELGEAAKLRVEKARLERALLKKCAELGTQVYERTKAPALPDGTPPPILEDEAVKALLQEIANLDADLEKAGRELSGDDAPGA